jgi:hypothetical protein
VPWREERVRRRIGAFMRQYERKASHGMDPNDRSYDRKIEQQIKRMPAEELDRLLREDDDGEAGA